MKVAAVNTDIDSGCGKAAGIRPGSERETARATSARETEKDAGARSEKTGSF